MLGCIIKSRKEVNVVLKLKMKIKNINKSFFYRAGMGAVNAMALFLVYQTANATCMWLFHQPEFPKEAEKFKRTQ